MTIGMIKIMPTHRGTLYTASDNSVYALLNGQSLPRETYGTLAAYWPVGTYGSTADNIVLPDLTESSHYQLRGHDFSSGVDAGLADRTSGGGALPTQPLGVGTFQTKQMASHTHPSGSQNSAQQSGVRDQGNILGSNTTRDTYPLRDSQINGPCMVSGTTEASLTFSTMGGYYYIRIK